MEGKDPHFIVANLENTTPEKENCTEIDIICVEINLTSAIKLTWHS